MLDGRLPVLCGPRRGRRPRPAACRSRPAQAAGGTGLLAPAHNERTAGERVNGRLKDEFGGRHVRVRGASKVMCHCMFGVLALIADQLVRLVT